MPQFLRIVCIFYYSSGQTMPILGFIVSEYTSAIADLWSNFSSFSFAKEQKKIIRIRISHLTLCFSILNKVRNKNVRRWLGKLDSMKRTVLEDWSILFISWIRFPVKKFTKENFFAVFFKLFCLKDCGKKCLGIRHIVRRDEGHIIENITQLNVVRKIKRVILKNTWQRAKDGIEWRLAIIRSPHSMDK